jgi:hypothetical protein
MTDQNLETADTGQAPNAPATAQASDPASGSSAASAQDETFFDPKEIPAELMPAYKLMQRAFTRKTQAIAQDRNKVEAYDRFMSDPVGQMQAIAKQYGFSMTRAEAKAAVDGDAHSGDWQPNSWGEVQQRIAEQARRQLLEELGPVVNEVKAMKQQSIERMLDDSIPEWREYEDEMAKAISEHPTLARYPEKLARLVIPEHVLEGRAMQKALKKLQAKGESARVSHGSQTSRTADADVIGKKLTFQEAVAAAKRKMERDGFKT